MSNITYAKLRGRIIEKYGSQEEFCKKIGLSSVSVSKKMTGKAGFSQKDILRWCEVLQIDLSEVGDFFYS